MKITGFRFARLRVPLKTPFKSAIRTVEEIDDIVVMIDTDDGHVGYGSGSPTPKITGDTSGSLLAAVREHIAPALIGLDVEDLNLLTARTQRAIRRNFTAKGAVECALHDLFGQRYGAATYRLLGGGEPALTTSLTISVDYIDKMVADAVEAVDRGFEAIKIVVGKDPGVDAERVKAIHAALSGRAVLRLDAGYGWTPKETVRVVRQLEEAGVRLDTLEHPTRTGDLVGMRFVTERVEAPVVAGIGDGGVPAALEVIRNRAADMITFSLLEAGGITPAVRICDLAAEHGMESMLGCVLEGPISVAAAAHLAVARADVITRVDLDTPFLARSNPVSSNVRFANAEITIEDEPGLGIIEITGLEPIAD
jgi:L-alanine-DL-glutamate epimerase-like enolase superfamily enzyme